MPAKNPALDLFGDVIVTEDDLYAWVRAVSPAYLSTERSYRNYVRSFDVAGKVKQSKLRGEFDSVTETCRPLWHARFALRQII